MMRWLLLWVSLLAFPVYAGNPHHDHSEPINVPDRGGSNFWKNAGEAALWTGAGCLICSAFDGCRIPFTKKIVCNLWQDKPQDKSTTMVPEPPKNEYTERIIIRPKR